MISHKLNEIEQIADSITIIRDGRTIETLDVKADGVDEDRIIRGMVGRTLESRFPDHTPKIGEVFFEVKDWTVQHPQVPDRLVVQELELHVRRGEIVGFAGLMGAGRTELRDEHLRPLLRQLRLRADLQGRQGDRAARRSPRPSTPGSAYVSEDRKALGLNLLDDIKTSTVVGQAVEDLARRGVVDDDEEYAVAEEYRKSLRIKAPDGRRGRRQALRRQPAEGRPGQVDVHRPGPADPRRAHPRHRRRRQVRDLRHHPAARRPGEGRHRHLLRAARAARALATASTRSSKAPSPASSPSGSQPGNPDEAA